MTSQDSIQIVDIVVIDNIKNNLQTDSKFDDC